MSDMGRSFSGSMPEFYDRFLVPVMFEPFARHLAKCLAGMASGDILELAAGTGVVTRALVRTLPATVNITATDLNPAMLAWAQSYHGMERVIWQAADASALPFPDQAFDKVVCQFGVMFLPDKQAAFREALRVLRPGGEFLFNVWGRRQGTPYQLAAEIVGRHLGRAPASLLPPYYLDVDTIISDLTAAGFGEPVVEELNERFCSPSAREAANALCGGGLLRHYMEAAAPDRVGKIADAVADGIAAQFGSGVIDAPLHAIFIACVRGEDTRTVNQKHPR